MEIEKLLVLPIAKKLGLTEKDMKNPIRYVRDILNERGMYYATPMDVAMELSMTFQEWIKYDKDLKELLDKIVELINEEGDTI